MTTLALNNGQPPQLDQFDKLPEILLFLREEFPEDHLYSKISAVPREVLLPQPWLLGASKESARSAGEYGINFSFAQFIHGHLPKEVLSAYYKHFRPVTEQQEPQVSAAYFTLPPTRKKKQNTMRLVSSIISLPPNMGFQINFIARRSPSFPLQ